MFIWLEVSSTLFPLNTLEIFAKVWFLEGMRPEYTSATVYTECSVYTRSSFKLVNTQYTVKNIIEGSRSTAGNPGMSLIKLFLSGNTSRISGLPVQCSLPLQILEKTPLRIPSGWRIFLINIFNSVHGMDPSYYYFWIYSYAWISFCCLLNMHNCIYSAANNTYLRKKHVMDQ